MSKATNPEPPAGSAGRAEPSRAGRTALPWVLIFGVALVLRLVYLVEVRSVPFVHTPVGDAASYHAWAQRIAAGDWLGSETFYQAPAYPYFVGVVYRLLGDGPVPLRVVQAMLGALSCVFLGWAGQSFFDRRTGLVAGTILALYAPALFFVGIIQKTTLTLVLLAALLALLGRLRLRPATAVWAAVGVLLALLGLTRENALVLALVLACWLLAGFRAQPWRRRLVWGTALGVGLLAPLGLVAWRNHHVGGVWALTTTQAGPNFWIGNNPDAPGWYVPLVSGHETPVYERSDARRLAEDGANRPLTDAEVSTWWMGRAREWIWAHPGDWITLLGRKLLLAVNAYEISDVEGYVVYRGYSLLLGVLATCLHFGVIAPLAAAGVTLTWARRGALGVLYAAWIALLLATAAFFVLARYRFPLVPITALLAAAALVEAWRGRPRPSRGPLVAAGAASLGAAILCNLPVAPAADLDTIAYGNLAAVLGEQGELAAAGAVLDLALEKQPDSPMLHFNRALVYRLLGDASAALSELRTVLELRPDTAHLATEIGLCLELRGDREEAAAWFARALLEDPEDPDARAGMERVSH